MGWLLQPKIMVTQRAGSGRSVNRHGSFHQNRYVVVDHFHKPALDRETRRIGDGFVPEDLQVACFEGGHQRGMFFQYLKHPVFTGKLYAVYIAAV